MTDQERKAMKMALEALLTCDVDYDYDENPYNTLDAEDVSEAIEALRQALNVDAIDTSSTYVDENEKREHEPVACECHRCIKDYGLEEDGIPLNVRKMILCPECGNKRCPKASDHRLDCTRNNESGQDGSIYTAEPWDTSDMAYRPNGLSVEQEPVAWVRDLTSPQPHCVTSLKYRSVADTDAGVKYIPVYTTQPSKPWQDYIKWLEDDFRRQLDELSQRNYELRHQTKNTSLAQPEQEPVAEVHTFLVGSPYAIVRVTGEMDLEDELFLAAPPSKPWVSLNDDEIIDEYCKQADGTEWAIGGLKDAMPFARAIEAALRSKNEKA